MGTIMDDAMQSALDAWYEDANLDDNEDFTFDFFKSHHVNKGNWEDLRCSEAYFKAYRNGKTTMSYTQWVETTSRRRLLSSKSGHPVFRRLLRKLRNAY